MQQNQEGNYVYIDQQQLSPEDVITKINKEFPCEDSYGTNEKIGKISALSAVGIALLLFPILLVIVKKQNLVYLIIVLTVLAVVFTELTYWYDNTRSSNTKCLIGNCRFNSFFIGTAMSIMNLIGLLAYSEQLWNLTGKNKLFSNKTLITAIYIIFIIVYKFLFSIVFTKDKDRIKYDGDKTYTMISEQNEEDIRFPKLGPRSTRTVIFATLQVVDILLPLFSLYDLGKKKNVFLSLFEGFKKTFFIKKFGVGTLLNVFISFLSIFVVPYLDFIATYSVYAVHPQNDLNTICKNR